MIHSHYLQMRITIGKGIYDDESWEMDESKRTNALYIHEKYRELLMDGTEWIMEKYRLGGIQKLRWPFLTPFLPLVDMFNK